MEKGCLPTSTSVLLHEAQKLWKKKSRGFECLLLKGLKKGESKQQSGTG